MKSQGKTSKHFHTEMHLQRPRERAWTVAERIGMAQKMVNRNRKVAITLPAFPQKGTEADGNGGS